MHTYDKVYINGKWVAPQGQDKAIEVFDSTNEQVMATIPSCNAQDVDLAAKAAAAAFFSWSALDVEERAKYMNRIGDGIAARMDELATAISRETGMTKFLSQMIQVGLPINSFKQAAIVAENFKYSRELGTSLVVREPIGVVGCITPWNYPLHQITAKVAFAMAAGCTVVLKPSEIAPIDAFILAEIIDEVGLPAGVFNLVTGTGPVVGEALAAHPSVDMISFTGSTRAGRRVSQVAAETVKKVALELGGIGTTVNCIGPAGLTRITATMPGAGEAFEPDAIADDDFHPMDPGNSSPLVAWLASDQASYVNGQVIRSLYDKIIWMQGWREKVTIDNNNKKWDATKLGGRFASEVFQVAPTGINFLQA